jgi:tetratricopeptide (TPR) repeat protein
LAAPLASPRRSADQVADEKARAAHAEGNTIEEERQFDLILAKRPKDPDALLGRARARLGNGNVRGAIEDLKQAAKHTDDPRIHAWLGYCYNQGPKHEWAIDSYRAALKGKFANAAVYNNLAYGYLQQGSFAEAEAQLRLAVEMDRELAAAWHNLAVLELRLALHDRQRVPTEGVRCVVRRSVWAPLRPTCTAMRPCLCRRLERSRPRGEGRVSDRLPELFREGHQARPRPAQASDRCLVEFSADPDFLSSRRRPA